MFEQAITMKIITYVGIVYLVGMLLLIGFLLDKIFIELNPNVAAIDTFFSIIPYILFYDFILKLLFKKNQSMQIAPYLALPIKRNKLFNFLLIKEFYNVINLYIVILILPFAFIAILPVYGVAGSLAFILFIYILSIIVSFLVSLSKISIRWIFLSILIVSGICATIFVFDIPLSYYSQIAGDWFLKFNPIVWLLLVAAFSSLWILNQKQMRNKVYREIQGGKRVGPRKSLNVPFLEKIGEVGQFMNLEIKLIFRSKQIRRQFFLFLYLFFLFVFQFLTSVFARGVYFLHIVWIGVIFGCIGMLLSQFQFMAESSYFDGLMARKHSFLNLIRAKYYIAIIGSTICFSISPIIILFGKSSFLFLFSVYVYYIGFAYFLMFQNGVYNKKHLDLFNSEFGNWRSSSSSQVIISMGALIIPAAFATIVATLFSESAANIFMLTVGIGFVLGNDTWLKWTCKRVMARKYEIMEGFRSNG